ncbi:hypothetical protein NP233_g1572 [Leucocoprinus birnbaumii]|uniref:DUF6534 domain-containing protein n=1 Tax=Leucocoprinus birnbaumii TaxID=56174 RepID=A0AAD5YXV5_9AGAR|nr:hypothetical protein NP233_g1572 [Leucocoprinus birnbaumii]
MLIGFVFNVFLFGTMTTQTYLYYTNFRKDRLWMKLFVLLIFILDTINSVCDCVYLYDSLIIHFGDMQALGTANWVFATDPAFTGVIAALVQLFFAWRVVALTKNWILSSVVILGAITGGVCGIVTAFEVVKTPEFTEFQSFKVRIEPTLMNTCVPIPVIDQVVVIIWLVVASLVDVIITTTLVWFFTNNHVRRKHKTGFKQSDLMVDRIIRVTVQTGLVTAIIAVVDLIVYLTDSTGTHLIFNFPLCKLYTNSLMSSLNSRKGWKYSTASEHSERPGADFDIEKSTSGQVISTHPDEPTGQCKSSNGSKKRGNDIFNLRSRQRTSPEVFVHVESHELRDISQGQQFSPYDNNDTVKINPESFETPQESFATPLLHDSSSLSPVSLSPLELWSLLFKANPVKWPPTQLNSCMCICLIIVLSLEVYIVSHGPMFLGTAFNVLLYGISITQTYLYLISFKTDRWFIRYFVYFLFVADTVHTVFTLVYMYDSLVKNFGNVKYLQKADWIFATGSCLYSSLDSGGLTLDLADPALTVRGRCYKKVKAKKLNLLLGHHRRDSASFLCLEVNILTQNLLLSFIILFCSIVSFFMGLATAVAISFVPSFTQFQKFRVVVIFWLGSSCLADVVITSAMVFYLRKHRTGFSQTDHQIDRIIRVTMHTGLVTALWALIDLMLYLSSVSHYSLLPSASRHLFFNFCLSKLYTNSLMSSLNSRGGWKYNEESDRDATLSFEHKRSATNLGKQSNLKTPTVKRPEVFVHVESHEMVNPALKVDQRIYEEMASKFDVESKRSLAV